MRGTASAERGTGPGNGAENVRGRGRIDGGRADILHGGRRRPSGEKGHRRPSAPGSETPGLIHQRIKKLGPGREKEKIY